MHVLVDTVHEHSLAQVSAGLGPLELAAAQEQGQQARHCLQPFHILLANLN